MKQFRMFVEDGIIDDELLELSSQPLSYREIPSLNKNKYMGLNSKNKDIEAIMRLVFSDQSRLNYISQTCHDENLFNLLTQNQLKVKEFLDYQKPAIEYLLKNGILVEDDDSVRFADADTLAVLSMLDCVGVVVYPRCTNSMKSKLDAMRSKHWLATIDTLLTPHEADYFDYCLNHKQFSNSLDLRNKYLHGSNSRTRDENIHRAAYIQGLVLMLALVIKVRDDFASTYEHGS